MHTHCVYFLLSYLPCLVKKKYKTNVAHLQLARGCVLLIESGMTVACWTEVWVSCCQAGGNRICWVPLGQACWGRTTQVMKTIEDKRQKGQNRRQIKLWITMYFLFTPYGFYQTSLVYENFLMLLIHKTMVGLTQWFPSFFLACDTILNATWSQHTVKTSAQIFL